MIYNNIEKKSANIHISVKHKLAEWFEDGLKQWDVTRDAPYFGFELPDKPGKWKIVNSFPDYKIQIVNSFPDFKIQYVKSFPGAP